MRWQRYGPLSLIFLVAVGCSREQPRGAASGVGPAASADASTALLEPLVMPQKPAETLSVRDALERKEGEVVVVSGRTPPDKVKPFNTAVAAFLLMTPDDLDRQEVKDEFDCDEAAT